MDEHEHPTQNFNCVRCGYNIIGASVGSPCPECGHVIGTRFTQGGSNGHAVASLVLGILALPACFAYGVPALILGTLAIIFARMAKRNVLRGEADPSSLGLAKAGQICGIVALSLAAILVAFFVGMLILGITSSSGSFQYYGPNSTPAPTTTP